ncbi:MAG: hypothetical protein P8182_15440, partial [Deltaproteobacteria bacterium]
MLMVAAAVHAAPVFVATAKNLRGAIYLGVGPTPYHASEMAISKCSQNSVIPPTCRVLCVRMECPPAPPPMVRKSIRKYKPIRKYSPRAQRAPYPNYNWGR